MITCRRGQEERGEERLIEARGGYQSWVEDVPTSGCFHPCQEQVLTWLDSTPKTITQRSSKGGGRSPRGTEPFPTLGGRAHATSGVFPPWGNSCRGLGRRSAVYKSEASRKMVNLLGEQAVYEVLWREGSRQALGRNLEDSGQRRYVCLGLR